MRLFVVLLWREWINTRSFIISEGMFECFSNQQFLILDGLNSSSEIVRFITALNLFVLKERSLSTTYGQMKLNSTLSATAFSIVDSPIKAFNDFNGAVKAASISSHRNFWPFPPSIKALCLSSSFLSRRSLSSRSFDSTTRLKNKRQILIRLRRTGSTLYSRMRSGTFRCCSIWATLSEITFISALSFEKRLCRSSWVLCSSEPFCMRKKVNLFLWIDIQSSFRSWLNLFLELPGCERGKKKKFPKFPLKLIFAMEAREPPTKKKKVHCFIDGCNVTFAPSGQKRHFSTHHPYWCEIHQIEFNERKEMDEHFCSHHVSRPKSHIYVIF